MNRMQNVREIILDFFGDNPSDEVLVLIMDLNEHFDDATQRAREDGRQQGFSEGYTAGYDNAQKAAGHE